MATAERARLTLELSPEMQRIVDELARKTGGDEADVFRRAVGLLKIVKDGQERGESPALVDKNGTVTTEISGI